MTPLLRPAKPVTINPLRVSQPMGAALAFLGLARAMPLEHGSRGCTAFSKLFFMRHFCEPIALQTTAMELLTTILGADGNIVDEWDATPADFGRIAAREARNNLLNAIADIRRRDSAAAFRSNFIVGYPGETEADFEATLAVVEQAQYDAAYTFIFSPRPGTEAAELVEEFVDPEVTAARMERLVAAVEASASMASTMRCRAESAPMVMSVPTMSLSMEPTSSATSIPLHKRSLPWASICPACSRSAPSPRCSRRCCWPR